MSQRYEFFAPAFPGENLRHVYIFSLAHFPPITSRVLLMAQKCACDSRYYICVSWASCPLRTWHFKERQFAATEELQYQLQAMHLNCDFAKGDAGFERNVLGGEMKTNSSHALQERTVEKFKCLLSNGFHISSASMCNRWEHFLTLEWCIASRLISWLVFLLSIFSTPFFNLDEKNLSWNILRSYFVLLR